jgi:hypothetical protein
VRLDRKVARNPLLHIASAVVRQCKADPQMAHLVFADKRVNAPKTKRAIFCQRTERLSELKM